MRVFMVWALMLGWLAVGLPAAAEEAAQVGGTYAVHGTNPNGTTYTGTVVITREGNRHGFSWLISDGSTFKGAGTRQGRMIVVDWGQKYPVVYEVGVDGVLHGKWDNGRASETLVPKP